MPTSVPSVVSKDIIGKAAEGAYRPGPWPLPVTGGYLPANVGDKWNWWQCGYLPYGTGQQSAIVEACVSAYSQTVAMCPGSHWHSNSKGGRDRVTTSALSRILREPNDYDTISDFLLNAVRQLYLDGNAYAYCVRNSRYEIDEIHLMDARNSRAQIAYDGSIFYALGGNQIVQERFGPLAPVPARDVLHIRLHTQQYNPLLGLSPLLSAAFDIAAGDAIKQQQLNFYLNGAKPSFMLSTDLLLDEDQTAAARDRFNQMARDPATGGVVILTHGLKPQPVVMSSRDAQLADVLKASKEDIALAFRIPLQILGLGGSPFGSTEALMAAWISEGLGFCLNHVEEAFGRTFGLDGQPEDYLEFDTKALMRSLFKDRIEALVRGVQGGVYSPNEARNEENLDSVKFGDSPRVQQQVVPLEAAAGISGSTPGTKPTIPPAPPAQGSPPAAGVPLGSQKHERIAGLFIERARALERDESRIGNL